MKYYIVYSNGRKISIGGIYSQSPVLQAKDKTNALRIAKQRASRHEIVPRGITVKEISKPQAQKIKSDYEIENAELSKAPIRKYYNMRTGRWETVMF